MNDALGCGPYGVKAQQCPGRQDDPAARALRPLDKVHIVQQRCTADCHKRLPAPDDNRRYVEERRFGNALHHDISEIRQSRQCHQ
jgi:hypothetical protein